MIARIVSIVICFVVVFISGYVLSIGQKPFNTALLAVHKLFSLTAFVLLLLQIVKFNKITDPGMPILALAILALLLFIATMASGGIISARGSAPALISLTHKILPVATVIAAGITLFFLVFRK
jgi:heme A synthase